MSNTKSDDNETISINANKTLTLKRTNLEQQGAVRQSFLHGRNKSVTVERKRKFIKPSVESEEENLQQTIAPPPVETQKPRIPSRLSKLGKEESSETGSSSISVMKDLSSGELEARRRALEEAVARESVTRETIVEGEEKNDRKSEQKDRKDKQEEEKGDSQKSLPQEEQELSPLLQKKVHKKEEPPVDVSHGRTSSRPESLTGEEDRGSFEKRVGSLKPSLRREVDAQKPRNPSRVRGEETHRRHKMTLNSALSTEEESGRARSLSAMRRRNEKFKRSMHQVPREKISREVLLPETITVQELAGRMSEKAVDVVKFFMRQGQMMKPGDVIDADTAELVAAEFGHTVKRVAESDIEGGLFNIEDAQEDLKIRPPVVSVMGHVDHGKTSLLDLIRKTNVAAGEVGGITQHMGAYQIERNNRKITFIDTPGHAAFKAMRVRGARATDIVILVVAADDGVMPQTVESIRHAKEANVPIIVAINKIDKPDANPEKIRQQLLQHDVFVETMGGETLDIEISVAKNLNIDKLLDTIFLQAELLDLKANPDRTAEGIVIESRLDKNRGPIATVLVQTGTLMPGDIIVAGDQWGRVRSLINDQELSVKEALPSTPVAMLGLHATPLAGDHFSTVENEARAREISEYRQRLSREKAVAKHLGTRGSLHQMISQIQVSNLKELPLLIKSDVHGSIDAIVSAIEDLGTEEVRARIVHCAPGGITESDVSLASTSGASIIAFNIRPNVQVRVAAEKAKIKIQQYNIIYDLIEGVKVAMSALLEPQRHEIPLGKADVLEVFNITKTGNIAGCRVVEGKVESRANARLIRNDAVIHDGVLATLKRFKDEAREVSSGQECGMGFKDYDDIHIGDSIEIYRVEMRSRSL